MKGKLKKIAIITLVSVVALVALVIIFISPITKYLVEKYDVKYTGREIKMDWAYVNPFTGYAYFDNFRMYEKDNPDLKISGDSSFIATDGIGVHFSVLKMLRKNYEITGLTLYQPRMVMVMIDRNTFNFTDMIDKFSSKDEDKDATQSKEPVHFSLTHIKIKDGVFHYNDRSVPVNYFVKKLNVESEGGYQWNVDTMNIRYAFVAGIGSGEMKGNFVINLKDLGYEMTSQVKKYDLNIIEQYMKDFSNYGTMRAFLDADIAASGSFKDAKALDAKGKLALSDFHFGKTPKDDYASFEKFNVGIVDLSPSRKVYNFDTLDLDKPYFKYEMYDHLDNIQAIFGKGGSNVQQAHQDETHFNLILEIADYVKKLVKDFFHSYYKINHFEIDKANFRYNDYSINEEFSAAVNPLTVVSDSIDKNRARARLSLKTGVDPYGSANLFLSANPKDSSDFDLEYNIQNIPVTMLNPYLVTYTSYNMDRGTVEMKGVWTVRNGKIRSNNHLLVVDPRIAGRVKQKEGKWIPMPLVMAFVRERSNVIDYEIPVTGDLKNPKFHISDVLWDLLKNIVIKPPTTPYGFKVSETEKKIEKTLSFRWDMGQANLKWAQEKFLARVAEFLAKHKEAKIQVTPIEYSDKEKEHILFFEAKKKYYMASGHTNFSIEDSLAVSKMAVKDKAFVKYLDQHGGTGLFTVQDKCRKIVDKGRIEKQFKRLNREREENFISFFKKDGTDKQITMNPPETRIPYNGFSFFKIGYNGEIPPELREAYRELYELDEWYPRNRYQEERNKIRNFFRLTNKNNHEIHSAGPLGGKP
jgi:hypothetical protein